MGGGDEKGVFCGDDDEEMMEREKDGWGEECLWHCWCEKRKMKMKTKRKRKKKRRKRKKKRRKCL